ncbi:hypothetical protein Micbo1qcDRAFT_158047, partial [Microdochium bolleyi]
MIWMKVLVLHEIQSGVQRTDDKICSGAGLVAIVPHHLPYRSLIDLWWAHSLGPDSLACMEKVILAVSQPDARESKAHTAADFWAPYGWIRPGGPAES